MAVEQSILAVRESVEESKCPFRAWESPRIRPTRWLANYLNHEFFKQGLNEMEGRHWAANVWIGWMDGDNGQTIATISSTTTMTALTARLAGSSPDASRHLSWTIFFFLWCENPCWRRSPGARNSCRFLPGAPPGDILAQLALEPLLGCPPDVTRVCIQIRPIASTALWLHETLTTRVFALP